MTWENSEQAHFSPFLRMLSSRWANGHFTSFCPHSDLAGHFQSMEASCLDSTRGFPPCSEFVYLCVCACAHLQTCMFSILFHASLVITFFTDACYWLRGMFFEEVFASGSLVPFYCCWKYLPLEPYCFVQLF